MRVAVLGVVGSLLAGPIVLGPARLGAQVPDAGTPRLGRTLWRCDGRVVSRIEIVRGRRSLGGLRGTRDDQVDLIMAEAQARAAPVLFGPPTRPHAILPFVLLRVGRPCTEFRRAESERLLRLQPYIADASVRTIPTADGTVQVVVETLDDIRRLGEVGTRGGGLSRLELTDRNVRAEGQQVTLRWRDGRAASDELGVRVATTHLFTQPIAGQAAMERTMFGHLLSTGLALPFLTDIQWNAWEVAVREERSLARFRRPSGDDAAVRVRRAGLEGAWVARSGRGETRWFSGGVLAWDETRRRSDLLLVDREGRLRPFAALDTLHRGRSAWTASALVGVRRLRFVKVRGFDALAGPQDIATGGQVMARLGISLDDGARRTSRVEHYLGAGDASSFVAWQGRVDHDEVAPARWATTMSGRLAWYQRPSEAHTTTVGVDYAGANDDAIPYQLTLDDPDVPVRGFDGSRVAGGQRIVLRAEHRVLARWFADRGAFAGALFADAGRTWAGTVPYGVDAARAAVGVSLLASVPRDSRTMLRIDLAAPLTRDADAHGPQLRVSVRSLGRRFWREPTQLERAHRAGPRSSIFGWP